MVWLEAAWLFTTTDVRRVPQDGVQWKTAEVAGQLSEEHR